MVNPVSGNRERATVTFAANTTSQPGATARAILHINGELQRHLNRYGRNPHRTLPQRVPTPHANPRNAFIALNTMVLHRPEAAIPVLRLLCREFATEQYALAQLYNALDTGDFNHLPEASQLTNDLDKVCAVDSMPNKDFVIDVMDQLISRFIQPARLKIEAGENVAPQQLRHLANLSVVLLKSLGKLSDNTVTTIGKLNTTHLERLGALYNIALETGLPGQDHTEISSIRNLLERKRNAILMIEESPQALENMDEVSRSDRDVVMNAVQRMGWSLSFASQALKNDREVALAAVNQYGWALGFASQEMRNDQFVVMSAVQNAGLAFQFASPDLRKNIDIAMAAVRQNPTALVLMSQELQRDPAIRALVFNRPQ